MAILSLYRVWQFIGELNISKNINVRRTYARYQMLKKKSGISSIWRKKTLFLQPRKVEF